jgi:hypothetical protein
VGIFSSTTIEIIKWVKKIAVAPAKVSHIMSPGKTVFKEQLKLVLKIDLKETCVKEKKSIGITF